MAIMRISKILVLGSSPSVPAKKIMQRDIEKKKILYAFPIALFSFEVYFGMILGYVLSYYWTQKVNSIVLNIGKYKFHLHHWLWALWILPIIIIYQFNPVPVQLASGFLGGLIIQGIFCYPDWHKILVKHNK